MRKLTYGLQVSLAETAGFPVTFKLVPEQTILESENFLFEHVVAAVKRAGFYYTVTEITEKVLDAGPCQDQGEG